MSKHILIIEDDADSRILYSEIAQSVGMTVSEAGDGESALESLQDGLPDLVILDLTIPQFDPMDFVNELRQKSGSRKIPVIVISGKEDVANSSAKIGAEAYLKKPIELDDIFELLNKWAD
ncbi:MAG: response regulator [Proteobacteria bacterium]|nr:MAG: response regulator [Pseudomonadota bacterium]